MKINKNQLKKEIVISAKNQLFWRLKISLAIIIIIITITILQRVILKTSRLLIIRIIINFYNSKESQL